MCKEEFVAKCGCLIALKLVKPTQWQGAMAKPYPLHLEASPTGISRYVLRKRVVHPNACESASQKKLYSNVLFSNGFIPTDTYIYMIPTMVSKTVGCDTKHTPFEGVDPGHYVVGLIHETHVRLGHCLQQQRLAVQNIRRKFLTSFSKQARNTRKRRDKRGADRIFRARQIAHKKIMYEWRG